MDDWQALYEETQHCAEKMKALLLDVSRSEAALRNPTLADRASLIRDRFQGLSDDLRELWTEYRQS